MAYGTVNADLMTTSDGVSSSGLYGFKSRIINGSMVIAQRGTTAVSTNVTYPVDRFRLSCSVNGKVSLQQSTTVPTGAGFVNSIVATSLSSYTVGVSETFEVDQQIEGYNTADLMWGFANAKTVTLSFWVRSSLTGTFGGTLENSGNTRAYPFSYTISSANTWEQKTITVAGDTSGTWLTDNSRGIIVRWSLGCGSNYLNTANTWVTGDYQSVTGETKLVATNGATWYITGVQLEKGSTATSFDYRPYGTELQLCQRYYEQYLNQIANAYVSVRTGSYYGYITWQVPKRAAPTILNYTSFNFAGSAGDINTVTSAVFDNQQVNNTRFYANSVGPFTAQSAYVYVNGTLSISAEL